jgi:hypothetical protein
MAVAMFSGFTNMLSTAATTGLETQSAVLGGTGSAKAGKLLIEIAAHGTHVVAQDRTRGWN